MYISDGISSVFSFLKTRKQSDFLLLMYSRQYLQQWALTLIKSISTRLNF